MSGADVAVVGAGLVGAAVACELARRGAEVVLVDRGEVSGATTGLGEGNVLCGDKDTGPELDLAVAGMAVWREVEERVGPAARIRRKGSLVVHRDAATWAAEPARRERLAAAGVHSQVVGAADVPALEPALTGAVHGATRFAEDLQCDPRAVARALAGEAEARGARVWTGTAVERVLLDGDGAVAGLATARGELRAGRVVLAAGPWSAGLAREAGLELPVEPRKGQLVRLRPDPLDPALLRHKVVEASYLLSVESPDAGLQLSTVVETTWDGHVLVGSSRERCGFREGVDAAALDGMVEAASALVPRLAALPRAGAWCGFRPWLPDGRPAIGASERVPGLWAATGHEGAGVGLGPVTGRVVAQAMDGEAPDVDLAPFAPDRFALVR